MTQFKGFLKLFLMGTMTFTNSCYPPLPAAFGGIEHTVTSNILMQSTAKSTSVMSEDAMHKKAKKDVQTMLKFMADWNRLCPNEGRQPNQFVPSEPPSGRDRDQIYCEIMQTWWRTQQCLRVYKLRLANSSLPENTAEAIRSSLKSYNFAKRGITLREEQIYLQQEVSEDPQDVHNQVESETAAGFIAEDSSDDDELGDAAPAPRPRGAIVNQPVYHEIPMPEPYHHELEFSFKCVEYKRAMAHQSHHVAGTSLSTRAMVTAIFLNFTVMNGSPEVPTQAVHLDEQLNDNELPPLEEMQMLLPMYLFLQL
jgi:hypothetical protein